METYDFVEEDIKSLIRNMKKLDYASGKYLEECISISKEGIKLQGDEDKIREILSRIVVTD